MLIKADKKLQIFVNGLWYTVLDETKYVYGIKMDGKTVGITKEDVKETRYVD